MRNLTKTKNLNQKLILLLALFLAFGFQSCQKSESEELEFAETESFKDSSTVSAITNASRGILSYNDFNTEKGKWYEESISSSWSANINNQITRAGKGSMRFELRKSDTKHGHRAELGQQPGVVKQEGWYGFANYFPKEYTADPISEIVAQFHSKPDLDKGEKWRSPPLALAIINDRFVLEMRNDPRPISTGEIKMTRLDLGPVEKEVWNDWVVHAKWAWDNTGVLEIWKNNKLIVSRKNMPNCYNDATYPYFKIGVYKWDWAKKSTPSVQKRIYYVDEVTIGNGSAGYNNVYPGRTSSTATVAPPIEIAKPVETPSNVSNAAVNYYNFNTSLGTWYERSITQSWSANISTDKKRAGSGSLRFELRKGDSKLGYRTELGQEPGKEKEAWYGFSNFFPKEFIKDPIAEVVAQFNSRPDLDKGEAWRSPPLALGIMNDRFILDMRHDANAITKGQPKMTRLDLGPVDKEVWNDWVIHVKWAWDNTGVLEIWKNNKLVVSRKNMPNAYNDATYPYFKTGIYKWDWANKSTPSVQKRVYFVDELTIGKSTATYNDVYPGRSL
jgi:hypothetical protein